MCTVQCANMVKYHRKFAICDRACDFWGVVLVNKKSDFQTLKHYHMYIIQPSLLFVNIFATKGSVTVGYTFTFIHQKMCVGE